MHGSATAGAVLRRSLAAPGDTLLQAAYAQVVQRGVSADQILRPALPSNGDVCDHGWGAHHIVAGGAVKGRLLPGTSVAQMAAETAGWMGVSATEMPAVLPNIGNFTPGAVDFL